MIQEFVSACAVLKGNMLRLALVGAHIVGLSNRIFRAVSSTTYLRSRSSSQPNVQPSPDTPEPPFRRPAPNVTVAITLATQ
jgi:hypothetical protein